MTRFIATRPLSNSIRYRPQLHLPALRADRLPGCRSWWGGDQSLTAALAKVAISNLQVDERA
jgi:hypothetical protein